jgi:hypothetical protein
MSALTTITLVCDESSVYTRDEPCLSTVSGLEDETLAEVRERAVRDGWACSTDPDRDVCWNHRPPRSGT